MAFNASADAATAIASHDKGPGNEAALTVGCARRAWANRFRASGIESPELDARILVGHSLGLDHAALVAAEARRLSVDEDATIAALAQRRLAHEPVARILGLKEFWSLQFRIDAATLVPRPETETVVEAALAAIEARGSRAQMLRIADLGTGSGAILLALLSELPNAFGVGTDVSTAALLIARDNARRLGLARAHFVACDMAAALRGPFDVIVCNPPYIASPEIAALAPEVRDFDPRSALDGGPDGLDFYRAIAASVPALVAPQGIRAPQGILAPEGILAPKGVLVVELGAGQAQPVAALFAAAGLASSPPRSDLTGTPRALVARRA